MNKFIIKKIKNFKGKLDSKITENFRKLQHDNRYRNAVKKDRTFLKN